MAAIVASLFDVLCGLVLHAVEHTAVNLGKATINFKVVSNLRDALLLGAETNPLPPSDRSILPALLNLAQTEMFVGRECRQRTQRQLWQAEIQ